MAIGPILSYFRDVEHRFLAGFSEVFRPHSVIFFLFSSFAYPLRFLRELAGHYD